MMIGSSKNQKNTIFKKTLCFIILISLIIIFNFNDANATSLSQRYGNSYSTHQTGNTGTVYGPAPNNGVVTTGYSIPVGSTITAVGVKIASAGGPTTLSSTYGSAFSSHQTGNTGKVFVPNGGAGNQVTLPVGSTVTSIGIKIFNFVNGDSVRIKLYNSTGGTGLPKGLLSETGSLAISGTGWQNFTVSPTQVDSNGHIFATYEFSSSSTDVYVSGGTGQCGFVTHTYGSGPSPFGTESFCAGGVDYPVMINYNTPQPHIRVKVYDSVSGNPKHLLGESGSLAISGTGWQNFTVNAVTNTTSTYVAYEFDNSNTDIYFKNPDFGIPIQTHVYGTGPNPMSPSFTANIGYTSLVNYNTLTAITLTPTSGNVGSSVTVSGTSFAPTHNITLKYDGTVLTTTPNPITSNSTGGFSGATFLIPNSIAGTHRINATDTTGNWTVATFTVTPSFTVQFKPMLHDNQTQLTSAIVKVTNSSTSQTFTANSTGWVKFTGLSGNQNFTVFDDKNFEVLKLINDNIQSNISQNLATYDTPFNCISSASGYQSDFVLRINDTDGTHVTNITTPTCPNQNQVIFNMTFTGNGQSGNTFSSSMITTVGVQTYEANPKNFTVSGTVVPTTFTGGNNILSNSFSVGSGLATTTLNFVITLTTTQSTASASQSGGQNYFTNNQSCFAGVFDPTTQTCVFGTVNISIANTTITTNPNQPTNNNIGIVCDGTGSVTVTSVNLGNNNLGIQVGQLPVTVNCGQTTPNTCPQGTTLTNGVCVAPLTCPIGSQTSNGQCVGTLTCPAGTTLQNQQCITQPTCPTGSVMVNNQCMNNGIPITIPPTPSDCSLLNPVACVTTTTQSQDVVVTATTSDGKIVTAKTVITSVQNPELNNVSLVIIFLILAAIIAGLIYRYVTRNHHGSRSARSGRDKSIKDFNRNIRKS